jgi:hypothetical protein
MNYELINLINSAKVEVADFEVFLYRFEQVEVRDLKTKKQAKTCSSKYIQVERQTIKETTEADRYQRLSSTSPSSHGLQPRRRRCYWVLFLFVSYCLISQVLSYFFHCSIRSD